MTLERSHRGGGGYIIFRCDSQGCYDSVNTHTDDFGEALTMLRVERWTTTPVTDKNHVLTWEHFCQQCSDEISRIKEDAMDTLLKGVPKK
jgi:hypothetical protein